MNNRQIQAMQLLRSDDKPRRLYEAGDAANMRRGSGRYFVTYSAGTGPELTRADVDELLRLGHIALSDPDQPEIHMYRAS